jgi:thioredoxin 1
VAKLNVDDSPSTAQQFGVMSIPTLILFAGGTERGRVVGASIPRAAARRPLGPRRR